MTFLASKTRAISLYFLCAFALLCCLPSLSFSQSYNIVYLLTSDKGQALDYKEDIEPILGPDISHKIRVMGKGKEYAVVFSGGSSPMSATRILVEHGDLLEKAGFDQPFASSDTDFKPLYNVSYGMGPNLDNLKRLYDTVYGVLGEDVGRNLFIEQTLSGNYILIYRRRGGKESTYTVARRHGKVLRSKKVKTSIAQENNNVVVFGESSLLDEEDPVVENVAVANVEPPLNTAEPVDIKKIEQHPVVEHKKPTPLIVKTDPTPTPVESETTQILVKATSLKTKVVQQQAPPKPVQPEVTIPQPVKKIYLASNVAHYKRVSEKKMREVKSNKSQRFEKVIETHIAQLRRQGKISADESTAWMVFDLAKDQSLVEINGNKSFQTASMIKPFVALAFFHKVNRGELTYGPKSKRNMAAMIQKSSNPATNWVMRQVGGPAATEKILKENYPYIFKGLQLTEYIPPGGRTYKNKTYPSDYVRFLRQLWDKKLPYSKEMRRLMALPGRDRLYYGTPIPRGTLVYNKTGSTAHLCGDMGILVPKTRSGSRYPYVIVGVIERSSRPPNYSTWVSARSRVIREVSTLVYKEMKKDHKLL